MLPVEWRPVSVDELVVVGPISDGGYVVSAAAIKPVKTLISMGLYDDWRFEEDFRRRTGAKVVCFDHSVTTAFWIKYTAKALLRGRFHQLSRYAAYSRFFCGPYAKHEQLKVGTDAAGEISLTSILRQIPIHESLFLKMDIEGGEYEVLPLLAAERSRFTGLVMELHDINLHQTEINEFLRSMPEFVIVAVHPNNFFPPDENGDPLLLEISLMHKDFVIENAKATCPIMPPTVSNKPEIELRFG